MELLSLLQAQANSITKQLRKLYIWVEERNLGNPNTPSMLGMHLMSELGKSEFTLIDSVNRKLDFKDSFRGRETSLLPFKNAGVRYLIIGEVETEYSSKYLNNFFYYAQGVIRITDVTNGEVITDIPIKSKGYHRSKKQAGLNALANAGKDVSKSIIDAILAIEDKTIKTHDRGDKN